MVKSLQEALEVPGVLEELRQHPGTFRCKQRRVFVVICSFRDGAKLRVMALPSPTYLDVVIREGRDYFEGPLKKLIDLLSRSLNFTKFPNGTWNGLIGATIRNETDLVLGPMSMSKERKNVVDFCYQLEISDWSLIARKGSLEVDPWAFLSTLSLSTWLLLLLALLASGAALVVLGLSRWARGRYPFSQAVLTDLLRILIQQGSWLLLTTLLVWAYSSTVTSALAVRFASRPIQSVRDILDDGRLVAAVAEATVYTDIIEEEETEVFKMLADLKRQGRLIYKPSSFKVGHGDYVFLRHESSADFEMAEEYLKSGKCEFYKGKERLLSLPETMVVPKGSPLLQAINHRLRRLEMSGIFRKWRKDASLLPNVCSRSPEKTLVKEKLKYSSIRTYSYIKKDEQHAMIQLLKTK
ncbi:glutamate receptor ionotropic, delta-2-like [Penaeus chinensis]|uniref:glutamate receptor ionotropic, delta-2-like n=1 Tax=Penaeus chinensis TaxID=139456 RepID=UPI001FB5F21A|nr:glutamate receptor ionotropic, delta-2-like [Penaeus chinensis]